MAANEIMFDMAQAPKGIPDPGTGKPINSTYFVAWVAISTLVTGETNTLPDPPYGGMTLTLWMKLKTSSFTRAITASTAFDSSAHTIITLDTQGDTITLMSVPYSGGYRWEVIANNGASLS